MLSAMFDPALVEPERIRPLSRKEYDRMVELGMFEDERIELLDGMLVEMSPQGNLHALVTEWFTERLIVALHTRYRVRCQLPYAASAWSEPEPDIAVFPRKVTHDHPCEALLLVEIADSSLTKDRILKRRIYAAAGVPEYWIVNLRDRTVEVHTRPTARGYERVAVLADGDVLRPRRVRGVALAIDEIPRARKPSKRRKAR
jgi:Uma2 family endonuclease